VQHGNHAGQEQTNVPGNMRARNVQKPKRRAEQGEADRRRKRQLYPIFKV